MRSLPSRGSGADALTRLRIKWLALGGFGVALFPFACIVEIAIWGDPQLGSIVVLIAGLVGIPVGVGIAMLRHDLYGVDRALITVVTWVCVTGMLVAFLSNAPRQRDAHRAHASVVCAERGPSPVWHAKRD